MAIDIKVGTDDQELSSGDSEKELGTQASMKMVARSAVDGSIMVFDHPDIDIILMPDKGKVLTLPKDLMTDDVYETQSHLFKHLTKKGLIEYDSIRGGNVYGSLEASLQRSVTEGEGGNPAQLTLFQIGKFIEDERPYFESERAYLEQEESRLLEPESEDTTELGEVPHASTKGSIRPGWIRGPFGIYDMYRV